MAGHLSYPISFLIWWEVLAPVKFILQFEYWSDSALLPPSSYLPIFLPSPVLPLFLSFPLSDFLSIFLCLHLLRLLRLNGLLLLALGLEHWVLSLMYIKLPWKIMDKQGEFEHLFISLHLSILNTKFALIQSFPVITVGPNYQGTFK